MGEERMYAKSDFIADNCPVIQDDRYEFNENVEITTMLTTKAFYLKFEDHESDPVQIQLPISAHTKLVRELIP